MAKVTAENRLRARRYSFDDHHPRPCALALDLILPLGRSGDRLLPGIIVMVFCLWAADRIASLVFWKTHLSDERWSIWDNRHRRRRRPG